jgi:hypothetical protein
MKTHSTRSECFTAAQVQKLLGVSETKLRRWSNALGLFKGTQDNGRPLLYSYAHLYNLVFVRTMAEHNYSPTWGAGTIKNLYESSGTKSWEAFWGTIGQHVFAVFGTTHYHWTSLDQVRVLDTDYLTPYFGEAVPVTVAFFLKEIVRAVHESIRNTSPSTRSPVEGARQSSDGFIPKYAPRKIKVNWIESDNIKAGYMHGVEFYHKAVGTRHAEKMTPIAFIEGFEWFSDPSQKSVKVKILRQDSPVLKRRATPAAKIIKDIHVGVKRFFEESPRSERITDVVSAWWNA